MVFGGVGEDFSFVSPHDAWLLRRSGLGVGVGLGLGLGLGPNPNPSPNPDPNPGAWLLRSATDVHPRRNLARPPAATAAATTAAAAAATSTATTAATGAAAAAPPPCDGPSARACLGLCADGLSIYAFGGFDGEHGLS